MQIVGYIFNTACDCLFRQTNCANLHLFSLGRCVLQLSCSFKQIRHPWKVFLLCNSNCYFIACFHSCFHLLWNLLKYILLCGNGFFRDVNLYSLILPANSLKHLCDEFRNDASRTLHDCKFFMAIKHTRAQQQQIFTFPSFLNNSQHHILCSASLLVFVKHFNIGPNHITFGQHRFVRTGSLFNRRVDITRVGRDCSIMVIQSRNCDLNCVGQFIVPLYQLLDSAVSAP